MSENQPEVVFAHAGVAEVGASVNEEPGQENQEDQEEADNGLD